MLSVSGLVLKDHRLGCRLSRAWIEALGGLSKTKPELTKLLVACLDFFFCLLTSLSQILYFGPKHAIHFLTSKYF